VTDSRPVRHLLILHAGSLGDCALAVSLALRMKAAWRDPAVVMAARSSLAKWARRRGLIDQVASLDAAIAPLSSHDDERPPDSTVELLGKFDLIVSFLGDASTPASRRLSATLGRPVVHLDPKLTDAARRDGAHITDQWAAELTRRGFPLPPLVGGGQLPPRRPLDLTLRDRLAAHLSTAGHKIALCHPGSGGLDKCCPLEAMEQLIGGLREQGWAVGWMVGPDEVERFGRPYLARLRQSAPVVYEESVEEAAELVSGADAYVGFDAGMTHVAALTGVTTLALFGPTDPRTWRPPWESCRVAGFPPQSGATWDVNEALSCIAAW